MWEKLASTCFYDIAPFLIVGSGLMLGSNWHDPLLLPEAQGSHTQEKKNI